VFIGFTGTPLLKADKQKSIEVFGATSTPTSSTRRCADGVVLDLRYEARDIDQTHHRTEEDRRVVRGQDQGPERPGQGAAEAAWGTMQRVLSSQSRLEKIVADILLDMAMKPASADGRPRQRHAGGRQHLRGLQVLRAVRQDRR
jgi:type I restriction enzyme R subunit